MRGGAYSINYYKQGKEFGEQWFYNAEDKLERHYTVDKEGEITYLPKD